MSALVRLSRRACLIAAVVAIYPMALLADGPQVTTVPPSLAVQDNLIAQNAMPLPITPTGEEVSEATAELMHGVWHIDVGAFFRSESSSMTEEEFEAMAGLFVDLDLQLAYAASGDAGMTMTAAGETRHEPGNWEVVEVTGNQVRFTVVSLNSDSGELETELYTATFVTTNYMSMTKLNDPMVLSFWRGVDEDPDAFVAMVAAAATAEVMPPSTGLATPDTGLATPQGGLSSPQAPTSTLAMGPPPASGSPLHPVPVTGLPVVVAQPSNLHGVWRADIASMLAAEAASMAPEELAMMQALMGSMSIDFEFRPDGTARMSMSGMGQAETKTGTWRLLSITGSTIQFELIETPALGTAPSPELFTAAFDSTNNMSLSKDGDPQVIPFYRP